MHRSSGIRQSKREVEDCIYDVAGALCRETGDCVDDGLYRVFVNTEVKDGTTVSEYMECFLKKEVNNSKFPAFTKRMNTLKHEERGAARRV